MNGSGSDGVHAVVEASACAPEVDGGDNVNCCLCSLDSIETLDSVIGVGVLLERVSSQSPRSSVSLAFVLTPEGRSVEEPWSEFNASLVFVYDEERDNSQKVKEIRFRKLRPKTGWWSLRCPRCFGKLGVSKTKNNQTLYAEGCQFALENCPNCKYKDFRSTEGIWKIAFEAVIQLRKIEKRSLWHFEFLCTKDDIKWLNDAHPTVIPRTCIPWQQECAERVKKSLEAKKAKDGLDDLEFSDLFEAKARLSPNKRIWWKAVSRRYFYCIWVGFLLILYAIFVLLGIHVFASLLIRFDVNEKLESGSISEIWWIVIAIIVVVCFVSVFLKPICKLETWSKKAKRYFSRHKFMQDSRARKVRRNISN